MPSCVEFLLSDLCAHDLSLQVISDLDVYGEVGSNKALILCAKTCVVNGSLIISFEGVIGNPTISAICVRRAPYSGQPCSPIIEITSLMIFRVTLSNTPQFVTCSLL